MKEKTASFFKKLKPLAFPTIYFILVIALACSIFSAVGKKNFLFIYIDGPSMQPTLNNNVIREYSVEPSGAIKNTLRNTEFGYADKSNTTKNNIKHFDIVVTYYSSDYNNGKLRANADYKIKRIIALPGETFKIESGIISYKQDDGSWLTPNLPFTPNGSVVNGENITYPSSKDHAELTLGENQYWVLGDNWQNSSDSQLNGPVLKNYIEGVLVAIEGTCTYIELNKKVSFADYNYYPKPIYYL